MTALTSTMDGERQLDLITWITNHADVVAELIVAGIELERSPALETGAAWQRFRAALARVKAVIR